MDKKMLAKQLMRSERIFMFIRVHSRLKTFSRELLLARGTGRRFRERGRAGDAVFVNRLHCEEVIVFREAFHHIFSHVPDIDAALPEWLVGFAPDDTVPGKVRLGVRLPRQSSVVFLTRRFETDA